ncbi:MAG: hypothetical protein IJW82_01140 [Clostridia bacterium]|nr:hypothetical protein [Clostridia bacterium]
MRGKKFNDDIKEKALAMMVVNNNLSEISRELNVCESTLRTWKNSNNDEFAKLRTKKKEEFVNRAWEVISLGQEILIRDLKSAIKSGNSIDLGKLTTIIGTMYDKQALASNESTMNVGVTVEELLKNLEGDEY